ncbi:hypothetical protein BJ875DRAFT_94321 [Amylocarpus encephaloides]|uniref:Heterokaryon incompatibility domain-containing protein n=1 Tax=Amylocarpus encephaloides TaxID=45428 RepID=A0A9P7YE08_9HELO|nr:hypothetical protein BJ875DRAFT_94321 [Amylocarpus encephaloides]
MMGISFYCLPKTIRRAVIITRHLGYLYPLVDSLCIVQDSPEEGVTRSALMSERVS